MKLTKIIYILTLVFFYYGCAADLKEVASHSNGARTVIKGGLLIDGTGNGPIPNSAIVIEGNTIKAIGPMSQIMIPSGATVIDASGKIILPGLIDMHVHYRDWMDQLFISHGVTTVRDLGNTLDYILEARKRSHKEGVKKPRIYTSGPFLDGSPPVFGMSFGKQLSYPLTTQEEAKSAALGLIKSKVDCIKTQQKLTLPLLKAIMEVAKKENIPVIVHLGDSKLGNIKASEAIMLGIKGIEHGSGINFVTASRLELEKISDMIVSHSVYVTPTLFMEGQFSKMLDAEMKNDPLLKQVPSYVFSFWESTFGLTTWWTEKHSASHRTILKKRQEFVSILIKKGGATLIVAGTDVPVPYVFPGVSLHKEMELLVSSGLTPMQTIMAATKNAADLLGHGDRLGTLEAGKIADLQILSANPLENISNLVSVDMVLRDGKTIWAKQ
jgi:imidazolonepropionase-like amidohydrolase